MEYNSKNIRTWSMLGACGTFGIAAVELAEMDKDFLTLTADLCFFSGLERLKNTHPDKIYNVGIAEQNMVGIAAGLAKEGMNVFATTYATFVSTRVLDQIKVNMGYMKLPIKMVGLTSGFSAGILGATHMALEDIAIMRAIPNITILSPADCVETMKAIFAAAKCNTPVYLRLSGTTRNPVVYKEDYTFEIGKAITLREGSDVTIITTGSMVSESLKAAKNLEEKNVFCKVLNIHTIKPLDSNSILSSCSSKLIVTVEEHSKLGGLGSSVAETLAGIRKKPPQIIMGVDDFYPPAASYRHLLEVSGLTAAHIEKTILLNLEEKEMIGE